MNDVCSMKRMTENREIARYATLFVHENPLKDAPTGAHVESWPKKRDVVKITKMRILFDPISRPTASAALLELMI